MQRPVDRIHNVLIIRDLGVLPDEAFEKYNNYRIDKLLKRLHHANEKLKKYSHVNKKASEQYNRFIKQRDQLILRKLELDKSAEVSICLTSGYGLLTRFLSLFMN